ncbi:MAG: PQQ-binding-like beta-propeller repeat protein, partial [Myxococcota bacterium]
MRTALALALLALLGGCARGRWSVRPPSQAVPTADPSHEAPVFEDPAMRRLAREPRRPSTPWTDPLVHVPVDWKTLPRSAVRWQRGSRRSPGTVTAVRALDATHLAIADRHRWSVVEARSGRELWTLPARSLQPVWDRRGRGVFVLAGRGTVEAHDPVTGALRWALGGATRRAAFSLSSPPAFVEDALVMVVRPRELGPHGSALPQSAPARGELVRVDLATGLQRVSRCRHACLLERGSDGSVTWVDGASRRVLRPSQAWPHGIQLAQERPNLVARDAQGRERWRAPVSADFRRDRRPAIGASHLALLSRDGRQVAIGDVATGRAWTVRALPEVATGLWVVGDTLLASHRHGLLTAMALEEETSAPREALPLDEDMRRSVRILVHGPESSVPSTEVPPPHPATQEEAATWVGRMATPAAPYLTAALLAAAPGDAAQALVSLRGG